MKLVTLSPPHLIPVPCPSVALGIEREDAALTPFIQPSRGVVKVAEPLQVGGDALEGGVGEEEFEIE